jgi:hypothetical protein
MNIIIYTYIIQKRSKSKKNSFWVSAFSPNNRGGYTTFVEAILHGFPFIFPNGGGDTRGCNWSTRVGNGAWSRRDDASMKHLMLLCKQGVYYTMSRRRKISKRRKTRNKSCQWWIKGFVKSCISKLNISVAFIKNILVSL